MNQELSTIIPKSETYIMEAKQKALAILKLILGDASAAEYLLISILSRVHTR